MNKHAIHRIVISLLTTWVFRWFLFRKKHRGIDNEIFIFIMRGMFHGCGAMRCVCRDMFGLYNMFKRMRWRRGGMLSDGKDVIFVSVRMEFQRRYMPSRKF